MDRNDTQREENKIEALRSETEKLEARIELLKNSVEKTERSLKNHLLKQIEILAVFAAIIALIITDVIGIDVLGSTGVRGLLALNLAYVVSTLLLLLGVRLILTGFDRGA